MSAAEQLQAQVPPAVCPACQRSYTEEQWRCLTWVTYTGAVRSSGAIHAVEVRRCICGERLGAEVTVPLARPARGGP